MLKLGFCLYACSKFQLIKLFFKFLIQKTDTGYNDVFVKGTEHDKIQNQYRICDLQRIYIS